jgi:hypothetical protein
MWEVQRGAVANPGHADSKTGLRRNLMEDSIDHVLARAIPPVAVREQGPLTEPRSYGVYALDARRSEGRSFRFGNHPVRMRELETEFGSCRLLHLFLFREDAERLCAHLNAGG